MPRWPKACLLLAVVVTAGCGASRTTTDTTTVTTTATAVHQARAQKPRTRTVTVTRTVATTSAAASTTQAAGSASGGGACSQANTYCGNGTENVGTITVSSGSTLQWACSGCAAFGIDSDLDGSNIISVSSTASSGSTFVDAGTYTNVRVISNGNWAFRLVPG